MKSTILLFCFLLLASLKMFSQTNVSGVISSNTTWTKSNSPYVLTGYVSIKNSAKLTIEKGIEIRLQNTRIDVDLGSLEADSVVFSNGEINFNNTSRGYINNSKFVDVDLNFDDFSKPTIDNNIFDVNSKLYVYSEDAMNSISQNVYKNNRIFISLNITKNLVIKNIPNIEYELVGATYIKSGAQLIINPGAKIILSPFFPITFENGIIDANSSIFQNGDVIFNNKSGGIINNCNFINANVKMNHSSSIIFKNNILDFNSYLHAYSENILPYLENNIYNSKKIFIGFTVTKDLTIKNIPDVSYEIGHSTYVNKGITLTLENGVSLIRNDFIFALDIDGILNAKGAYIKNMTIDFNLNSYGNLDNCDIINSIITVYHDSEFNLRESNIDKFSTIQSTSTKIANAKNNYWGDPSGPKHSSLNPSGLGTTLVGNIDFKPFNTSPIPITVSVDDDVHVVPVTFNLLQNFPNPFNPTTNIEFQILSTSFVTLEVYDILGRKVSTLLNEEKEAGKYNVSIDASNLSSGVYFYTLSTKDFMQTKKMILIR